MTKTLFLLRHANAMEADATMDDYDRPLSANGLEECEATGAFLHSLGEALDAVIVSSALRTRQTAEAMLRQGLFTTAQLHYDDGLYLASVSDMLQRIHALPEAAHTALMVGHNPGIGEGAAQLAHSVTSHYARHGMRTCGLVRLVCDEDNWTDVTSQRCVMTHYFTP
jgi:phosphohistidine phosphatase